MNVHDFIKQNRLSAEYYDMDKLLSGFLYDMEAGLEGRPSSFLMLPSYVNIKDKIQTGFKAAVIDAGGTNFRTALVYFDKDGTGHIEDFKKYNMPGTKHQITKDELFEFIAGAILPYLEETDRLTISFAYPVEILSLDNGRILKMDKELKITNIEGCFINREINKILIKKGKPGIKTFITNDAVAAAMSGLPEACVKGYDACIGVIAGTGTNVCYPESYVNIKKLGLAGSNRMMINVESGNFDKIQRGPIDIQFDRTTDDPGYHQLEKMVSGAYIGALAEHVIKKAAASGLLSLSRFNLEKVKPADLSAFINNDADSKINGIFENSEDRKKIKAILDALIRRSAHLIALQTVAASLKAAGENSSVLATVEGTIFYKTPGIKETVADILKSWLYKKHGVKAVMKKEDNAVLLGSAAIALTV